MSGKGERCFARYIEKLTGARDQVTFETVAGIITGRFTADRVTVNLTTPKDLRLDQEIAVATGPIRVHSLNTGVPQAVVFVEDAARAERKSGGWGGRVRLGGRRTVKT